MQITALCRWLYINFSGKSIQNIQHSLTHNLEELSDWLIDNKLSLHLGKTESILFSSRSKLKTQSKLQVSCGNVKIDPQEHITYLGALISQDLSGETMANNIIKKANAKLKYLYRQCKFLPSETKRTLASALILCHFDYASCSWYSPLSQGTKNKLQICQNKVIRFILGLGPRSHIGAKEFEKVNWLPINLRVEQIKLNHMFKIFNTTAPSYLCNLKPTQEIHKHNTRHSKASLRCHEQKSPSFSYTGTILWNNLPNHIQSIQTLSKLKTSVKKHLTSKLFLMEKSEFVYF